MAKGRPVSAAKHAARLRIKALRRQQPPDSSVENYVAASQPGCHVVHKNAQWIVGVQKHRSSRCPDIVIDPESGLLSVYNRDDYVKSFTISFSYPFLDAKGHNLEHGTTRTDTGEEKECITLVLVVNGHTLMDVGYLVLPPNMDLADVCIDSDIKAVTLHSDPDTIDEADVYSFPLDGARFLCSQGFNGSFTHYFASTHHALDLQGEVGTPILAVGDGVVREVHDTATVGGVRVRNLFQWNSIMLEMDNGSFVEYVHIKAGSAAVRVNDRVQTGQKICELGDVGFCPTPHLHIQVHHSCDPTAPTVRFAFKDGEGQPYVPEAGKWYGPNGLLDPPEAEGDDSL